MISEALILFCAWGEPDITQAERLTVEAALACQNATDADPWLLVDLLRLEQCYLVPDELRGVLLARSCNEAGFNPNAVGDPNGDAVGLCQWHPWASKYIDRRNPLASMGFLLDRVLRQLPLTARDCPDSPIWSTAYVRAIRSPGLRCNEEAKEIRLGRRWFGSKWGRI